MLKVNLRLRVPSAQAISLRGCSSCQSRGIRGKGRTRSSLPFAGCALFLLSGALLVLRPPSLCCGYLPQSPLKFHLFHKVLQPTGFDSSFSFTVSSPEVRLNPF